MNKHENLCAELLIAVALCIGIVIGCICGTYLYDFIYPNVENTDGPSDAETSASSASTSATANQTTASSSNPGDVTPKKRIALTFDDGPRAGNTQKVLDLLAQYDAKATFFVCGSELDEGTKSVLQRAIALGCEIGNHSYSHKSMTEISKDALLKEIRDTNELISRLSGTDYVCKMYRPPYGSINRAAMNSLYDSGIRMHAILWSSDSLDWEYQNRYTKGEISRTEAIEGAFNTIVRETSDGTVILMHDIHEITPDILARVLEKYSAEGYEFVTVSELFGLESRSDKDSYFKRYRSTNSILDTQ